jgi:hypothetical protein
MAPEDNTTTEDTTEAAEGYTPPAEELRKGYAVYDTTLQQYVGPVTTSKPSKADAGKLVAKGHDVEVRPV